MSTELIKKLRDKTRLSFSDIKSALDEAGGEEIKAMEILKQKGVLRAGKKSQREIKAGLIDSYVHSTKRVGAMVELGCETDFVARNPEFQNLAHELAMHIAAMSPKDVDELMDQGYIKDESIKISDLINQAINRLGENIKIGQFVRFEV